jgi:hypothetical protein
MPYHGIVWDEYRCETIAKLAKNGKTLREIGEYFGVSRQRILQIIKSKEIDIGDLWGRRLETSIKNERYRKTYKRKWGHYPEESHLRLEEGYDNKRRIFRNKVHSAKATKWEWNIDFGDIEFPDVCPVLGIELDYTATRVKDNSVSFDRIDPSKGYVKGNVAIISFRANRLKSDGNKEEFRRLYKWLDRIEK